MANDKDGRIILDPFHYISVGELSYDLVVVRNGTNKKGEKCTYEKTLGYYSTIKSAIKAYIRLEIAELMRGNVMELNKFIEFLAAEEERLDQLLESISPSGL